MTTLLLRLAGPLQSWGDRSRYTRRDTRPEPTKSGVLGLLAAADGRRRTDDIEDLAKLSFGVRVDQPGRLTRDFQTAIRWSSKDHASMPLSYRYYLADAVFVAAVTGDESLLRRLDEVTRRPAFPLYLGRRSCPAEGRISLGITDAPLDAALRDTPWMAKAWYRRQQPKKVYLRVVLDAQFGGDDDARETVRDVPLSFSPVKRDYGWREVAHADPVEFDNPDGHDRWDFIAALGG